MEIARQSVKTKCTIFIILVLSLYPVLLLTPAKAQIPITSQRNTLSSYHDIFSGYTLQYPSNWNHTKIGYLNLFYPLNQTAAVIAGLVVYPSPAAGETSDQIHTDILATLHRLHDFQLLRDDNITLAGLPAHKIVYTTTYAGMQGTPIAGIYVYTLIDNKVINLIFTSIPDQFPIYAGGEVDTLLLSPKLQEITLYII